jgi:hypothetical protein
MLKCSPLILETKEIHPDYNPATFQVSLNINTHHAVDKDDFYFIQISTVDPILNVNFSMESICVKTKFFF